MLTVVPGILILQTDTCHVVLGHDRLERNHVALRP